MGKFPKLQVDDEKYNLISFAATLVKASARILSFCIASFLLIKYAILVVITLVFPEPAMILSAWVLPRFCGLWVSQLGCHHDSVRVGVALILSAWV